MIKGNGSIGKLVQNTLLQTNEEVLIDAANPLSLDKAELYFKDVIDLSKDYRYLLYFSTTKDVESDEYCQIKQLQKKLYGAAPCKVITVELAHMDAQYSFWSGIGNARCVISNRRVPFIHYNNPREFIPVLNSVDSDIRNNRTNKIYVVHKHDLFSEKIVVIVIPSVRVIRLLAAIKRRIRSPLFKYLLIDTCDNLAC